MSARSATLSKAKYSCARITFQLAYGFREYMSLAAGAHLSVNDLVVVMEGSEGEVAVCALLIHAGSSA